VNSGFPHLFHLAICYLSVPGNFADANHSFSMYMAVNAPQKQIFNDTNFAQQVMVAFNARV